MSIFARKVKTPQELVSIGENCMNIIEQRQDARQVEKAKTELYSVLGDMKVILMGTPEVEPNPDTIRELTTSIVDAELLCNLVLHVEALEFEARKNLVQIFSNLLRRQFEGSYPMVDYICRNAFMIDCLIVGYENLEVSMNCGSMLQECIRHEELARLVFRSENFWKLFQYVSCHNFDIQSDAFKTFKELLTTHKTLAAEFLAEEFDAFFGHFMQLLDSDNYATQKLSLKLLGELLLDRSNYHVMTRFITIPDFMKKMMVLLRSKKGVSLEAFNVFKIFAANPKKPPEIVSILLKNRDKLIDFFEEFQKGSGEDHFKVEKEVVINAIRSLDVEDELLEVEKA